MYFEPVMSIDVGNENTSMILRDLEPLVVYKITVAAISNLDLDPKVSHLEVGGDRLYIFVKQSPSD